MTGPAHAQAQADQPTTAAGTATPAPTREATKAAAVEMTERWLAVRGYEGLYEVSDHGRVRGRRGISRTGQTMRGYQTVRLYKHFQRKALTVHRLVLEAFVGPRPANYECRHLDGDKTNNRISNISWGTRRENQLDNVRHGTHPHARKTHCPLGHDYYVVRANGERRCRTCYNASRRALRRRKEAAVGGGVVIPEQARAKADADRVMACPAPLCLLLLTHGGMDCWCRKRKKAAK
jgi:hypothetical protein